MAAAGRVGLEMINPYDRSAVSIPFSHFLRIKAEKNTCRLVYLSHTDSRYWLAIDPYDICVANHRNVSLTIYCFKRNLMNMYFCYMFKLHCRVFMGLLLQTERGEYEKTECNVW